ncbi:MAG: hypothetical protein L3J47_10400 [Sulfurovum sp.]|nr:hypothetical protein [Sulfurovum sp.]
MKYLITTVFILTSLLSSEIKMPKQQKFYISGVEFDTQVYCADFNKVIQQQQQRIKALEAEVAQLRKLQQKQLSKKLQKEHQAEVKRNTSNIPKGKSRIIISDKPIQ